MGGDEITMRVPVSSEMTGWDEDARSPSWGRRVGEVIGDRYWLVQMLGRGAMGEAWLAVHLELKSDLVIQFMREPRREMEDEEAKQRFRLEAQLSARLCSRTRHVTAVYDAGEHEGVPYFVMEYVPGASLHAELAERGALDPAQVCDVLDQIADALEGAHLLGVVHRDVKPANVMLCREPGPLVVKLADFGIAKALRDDIGLDRPDSTCTGFTVGTLVYMSPEQVMGLHGVDHRSDLWALGVLAYEALTGRNPFDGATTTEVALAICAQPVAPPSSLRAGVPRAVDAWFERALAKDKEARFCSAVEMAHAFREAMAAREPEAPRVSRRLAMVVGAAAALVGVVLTLVTMSPSRPLSVAGTSADASLDRRLQSGLQSDVSTRLAEGRHLQGATNGCDAQDRGEP